uniref:Uncharacterized protein n=1 Tax=Magallana gigas TaxID=29159 RepID=K1QRG5_MAGGI
MCTTTVTMKILAVQLLASIAVFSSISFSQKDKEGSYIVLLKIFSYAAKPPPLQSDRMNNKSISLAFINLTAIIVFMKFADGRDSV